tara:strand:- start:304 stop:492 length:189 start_codon:yes stop_codon:yes gene_type:complete
MQFYRKTRRGVFGGLLIRLLIKIFISIAVIMIIIFFISKLDLPAPNKLIKKKIPDEKLQVIK